MQGLKSWAWLPKSCAEPQRFCRTFLQQTSYYVKRSAQPSLGQTLTATVFTKRPLQNSAIIFSIFGLGESAFNCANHRVSCKCQQPSGWKIHRFFRWKMPFAVLRSGSRVSEISSEPQRFRRILGKLGSPDPSFEDRLSSSQRTQTQVFVGNALSGSHRATRIASDLALQALGSQAKPQRESESQAFRTARS